MRSTLKPHVPGVNATDLIPGYVNFLLVMVPVGITTGKLGWNPIAVFTINFIAIMPLAAVMSFATEEISLRLGETMGGLLNATFRNAVELIVRLTCERPTYVEIKTLTMTAVQHCCARGKAYRHCPGLHARVDPPQPFTGDGHVLPC